MLKLAHIYTRRLVCPPAYANPARAAINFSLQLKRGGDKAEQEEQAANQRTKEVLEAMSLGANAHRLLPKSRSRPKFIVLSVNPKAEL